ncbi:IPT/TIG domain-containing protein [Streptomyces sp. NPDC096012]|uniref:IPT/TIG domain-containing protein n=1 Tax=Streptomyces sp. NPDC096012 TaxID=3155684 RepID=UPI00336A7379
MTVTGSNLDSTDSVTFEGTPAPFAVINATTLSATPPGTAGAVDVVVTDPAGSSPTPRGRQSTPAPPPTVRLPVSEHGAPYERALNPARALARAGFSAGRLRRRGDRKARQLAWRGGMTESGTWCVPRQPCCCSPRHGQPGVTPVARTRAQPRGVPSSRRELSVAGLSGGGVDRPGSGTIGGASRLRLRGRFAARASPAIGERARSRSRRGSVEHRGQGRTNVAVRHGAWRGGRGSRTPVSRCPTGAGHRPGPEQGSCGG